MKYRKQITFKAFLELHGLTADSNIHLRPGHERTKVVRSFDANKCITTAVPNHESPRNSGKRYLGHPRLHAWNFPDPAKRKMARELKLRAVPESFTAVGTPRKTVGRL